jgi:hypothetical protein
MLRPYGDLAGWGSPNAIRVIIPSMKPDRRPPEFIERLSETPIDLKPFDPLSKQAAGAYGAALNQLLAPLGASAELFGSVELEIAGKGEWEFAIYLDDARWYPVLVRLINHFGTIYTLRDDFAVFTAVSGGTDVEVIPMRGETEQRNRAIMSYWRNNPAARHEYEQGKLAHAYSRREYYRWKDEFIARIVERL